MDKLVVDKTEICFHCHEKIIGKTIYYGEKAYHLKCAKEQVYPNLNCYICGHKIISGIGNHIFDGLGNHYHADHLDEFPRCDCCGSLILNLENYNGFLADGRNYCKYCIRPPLSSMGSKKMLLSVINFLGRYGVVIDVNKITLILVDRLRMNDYRKSMSDIAGFCRTDIEIIEGFSVGDACYQIYILDQMHEFRMEQVLMHELFHSWIRENTDIRHSRKLEEGSCRYIEYIYLSSKNSTPFVNFLLRQITMCKDSYYGDGFRAVQEKFGHLKLDYLLNYLKSNREI